MHDLYAYAKSIEFILLLYLKTCFVRSTKYRGIGASMHALDLGGGDGIEGPNQFPASSQVIFQGEFPVIKSRRNRVRTHYIKCPLRGHSHPLPRNTSASIRTSLSELKKITFYNPGGGGNP